MGTNFSDEQYRDLQKILAGEHITPVFQPIISLTSGKVLGYEALSRVSITTSIPTIEDLFRLSDSSHHSWALDHLCRRKSLEAAYKTLKLDNNEKLFLNVNPMIMHDKSFKNGFTQKYLSQFSIESSNIVFEITERTAINDMESFQSTLTHYKNQSFKIAIDDVGACYSGLNLILDVQPHYIKLDMKLIRDVNSISLKYALIKGMVELSRSANISLIAEGIETVAELETLIHLGVPYGQGYFIQKPLSQFSPIDTRVIMLLHNISHFY